VYVHTRQRTVFVFLNVEDSGLIHIHRRLRSESGEDSIDVSSVGCWARRFKISGKVKEPCQWNSWKQAPQSNQSNMCTH